MVMTGPLLGQRGMIHVLDIQWSSKDNLRWTWTSEMDNPEWEQLLGERKHIELFVWRLLRGLTAEIRGRLR